MTHRGVRPCNLRINGAPSPDRHNSTGRVIHQRNAVAQGRQMHFPVLTWMLDNQSWHNQLHVVQGIVQLALGRAAPLTCFVSVGARALPRLRRGKHNICKCGELILFALSCNCASSYSYLKFHAGSSQFGSPGISHLFFLFSQPLARDVMHVRDDICAHCQRGPGHLVFLLSFCLKGHFQTFR